MRQNSIGMEPSPATQNQDITSKAMTLLDSRIAPVSAPGATREPRLDEGIQTISSGEQSDWYFLLLRSKEINRFNELLSRQFTTFMYTALDHRRRIQNCLYTEAAYTQSIQAAERAMEQLEESAAQNTPKAIREDIAGGGYLFVNAPLKKLQQALEQILPRKLLMMDFATRKPARIPASQMKNFIFFYETMPWNLQFMQHPISDYARKRDRVRITGGSLQGAEGYIVRQHRDRCLVFAFGNMTLSISGIHSFPFEKVEK